MKKEDERTVLVHARSIIEKRNDDVKKSDFNIARYEDSLLDDYRKYLTCLKYELGNRKDANGLTKALFELGLNTHKIVTIITEYYNSLIENLDNSNRDKYLDFCRIYCDAADRELLSGRVNNALEIYDLILLDWDFDLFGERKRRYYLDDLSKSC